MKRNILTALLSLVIAFGLWLYVVTVVSPNSDNTYNGVSVVLQGEAVLEERGLMITTRQLPTVSLRLEGNRSELQKLNSSNISVTVDVSKIVEPGEHNLTISPNNIRLPGDVSSNAITVASRNPDYIKLEIKKRESKPVPVSVQYNGEVPIDYVADKENCVLDYNEVQISGPSDVIEKIAMARVEVDLTDKTTSIKEDLPITLCDEQGLPVDAELVTTDTATVNLNLRILRLKQVYLKVNVLGGAGATEQTSTIERDPEYIFVSGTEDVLANLDTITVGTINLGEIFDDTTELFAIELPEGVVNETETDEVTVNISFPNLAVKTLDVTNIVATNVPEGKSVEFVTKTLQVRFRGPKALIDALQPEHVTVTVDCINALDGISTLRTVVTLSPEYAQIGAVGSYTVSATLS